MILPYYIYGASLATHWELHRFPAGFLYFPDGVSVSALWLPYPHPMALLFQPYDLSLLPLWAFISALCPPTPAPMGRLFLLDKVVDPLDGGLGRAYTSGHGVECQTAFVTFSLDDLIVIDNQLEARGRQFLSV